MKRHRASLNPYLKNGFFQLYQLGESTFILGVLGVCLCPIKGTPGLYELVPNLFYQTLRPKQAFDYIRIKLIQNKNVRNFINDILKSSSRNGSYIIYG